MLLEAEDFDLLHLNEPFVPGLGWTALRHAACPLVATFHANPESLGRSGRGGRSCRRLFDSLDAAIASSAAVRDAAALTFPGAYRVIPPGVDLSVFHPADERAPGPLRVLFAAPASSGARGSACCCAPCASSSDRAAELRVDVCGARLAGAPLRAAGAAGVRGPA